MLFSTGSGLPERAVVRGCLSDLALFELLSELFLLGARCGVAGHSSKRVMAGVDGFTAGSGVPQRLQFKLIVGDIRIEKDAILRR